MNYQKTNQKIQSRSLVVTNLGNNKVPDLKQDIGDRSGAQFNIRDGKRSLIIKLTGTTFPGTQGENRQIMIEKLHDLALTNPERAGQVRLKLQLQDNNPHDKNAIDVLVSLKDSPRDGWSVGWIPSSMNEELINYFSNFKSEFRNNINKVRIIIYAVTPPSKIRLSSNNIRPRYQNTLGTVHIEIPLEYDNHEMFPRPGRLGLIEY